jgi:hypothetical protein
MGAYMLVVLVNGAGVYKMIFSFSVMGLFDWPITKKNTHTMGSPKIGRRL